MCSFTDCGSRGAALIFTLSWAASAEAARAVAAERKPLESVAKPLASIE
jgi:hypothetical protein